jgi:hypothetical protein
MWPDTSDAVLPATSAGGNINCKPAWRASSFSAAPSGCALIDRLWAVLS